MHATVSGLTHAAMLDASPIAASVVDREGTVVYVNDAFLAYARAVRGVEIQREERIGGNIREFSTGNLRIALSSSWMKNRRHSRSMALVQIR